MVLRREKEASRHRVKERSEVGQILITRNSSLNMNIKLIKHLFKKIKGKKALGLKSKVS